MLWLWHRLAATAPIGPLAWEPPYASGAALEKAKRQINLWDATKVVLRGKFIVIQVFCKKEEKSQVDNLTHHLNEGEKEEQTKPEVSRRKEITKIREEIIKIDSKNNRQNQ